MGCGNSSAGKADTAVSSKGSADASKGKPGHSAAKPPQLSGGTPGADVDVLGKYTMHMDNDSYMGEGTSSICRKGTRKDNGEPVAIKVYKEPKKAGGKALDVMMHKFKRQIGVLEELLAPFQPQMEKELWHEKLATVTPAQVFMQLLDYSKDADGKPGGDVLYVISELAQYSLKDFLAQRREQRKPLSADSVRNVTKAIVLAMAGLAAKGFVHLDMKPENMMMFNGRLKVIDVDGCVKSSTTVSISDSSISFSPCYCAPEWARFLIKDGQANITASALLDSWSVGMTLCELITLDAVFKPMYANFLRNAHSHREAGFLFMEWLGGLKRVQFPKAVEKFDPKFLEILSQGLLVCDKEKRKTCAQCLSFPYISAESGNKETIIEIQEAAPERLHRLRNEDDTTEAPLYKGTLYKLNTDGDPKDLLHWIKRDIWIAHNHSLCYYSQKEGKKLVLLDGSKLASAVIEPKVSVARDFSFDVKVHDDGEGSLSLSFAAETAPELKEWLAKLNQSTKMELLVTMKLGIQLQADLEVFRMQVKNRRLKIDDDDKEKFEPVFQGKLWKVKGEGDRHKELDWFLREMWIAKNGCLVYHSEKEDRNLIFYTAADMSRATCSPIQSGDACKPWAFMVQLPPANGVEFAPGEFAAESEDMCKQWIAEFKKQSS